MCSANFVPSLWLRKCLLAKEKTEARISVETFTATFFLFWRSFEATKAYHLARSAVILPRREKDSSWDDGAVLSMTNGLHSLALCCSGSKMETLSSFDLQAPEGGLQTLEGICRVVCSARLLTEAFHRPS